MPIPTIFRQERHSFPKLKKAWMKIKMSAAYQYYIHSDLYPSHWGKVKIKAETPDAAREMASESGIATFLYKGEILSAETRPQPGQDINANLNAEAAKYNGRILRGNCDVSDRIPRDKDGNFDLFGEEPIVISINPIEGPALIGHASIQYKDQVVNRLLNAIHIDGLYPKYQEYSQYYFIYPSQVGINPKKFKRILEKHNIRRGDKKYNLFTNNCAKNVAQVLREAGVKDLDFFGPDKIGLIYETPGNNPFNVGLKAWCLKHGVHVFPEEMAEYDARNPVNDVKDRRIYIEKARKLYRESIKNKKRLLNPQPNKKEYQRD